MKKVVKKYPMLEIRQKKGAKGYMVGANTEVLLDGKPIKGAQAVSFQVNARGLARAQITLVGKFNLKGKPLVRKNVNKY